MCDGGFEPWDFFDSRERLARKPHKCLECEREIEPGERYLSWRGRVYGDFAHGAVCAFCVAFNERFQRETNCCPAFGELWYETREAFEYMETFPARHLRCASPPVLPYNEYPCEFCFGRGWVMLDEDEINCPDCDGRGYQVHPNPEWDDQDDEAP